MKNDELVYVLGAGLNKAFTTIKDPKLSPPLSNNLFNVATKLYGMLTDYDQLKPLFDYIEKYWRKNKSDLENDDFNMEECFTLLHTQLLDARTDNDTQRSQDLLYVEWLLIGLFAEVLSRFKPHCELSNTMMNFGRVLYNDKPMIITFNYDTFVESMIEKASGNNCSPIFRDSFQSNIESDRMKDVISSSRWNWNRPLAYGIEFDRVQIHDGAVSHRKKFFDNKTFYSHEKNTLYSWCILKLHGSLNWWRYLRATPNPNISVEELRRIYESKKRKIVLQDLDWSLSISPKPWNEDQLYVEPIIITPVLYKQYDSEKFLYNKIYEPLWKRAKDSLQRCKFIVIIGYSLPMADFRTRQLLLEAFSDNIAEELIIVNPNDNAVEEAKRLVQFKKLRVFSDLEKFIQFRRSKDS